MKCFPKSIQSELNQLEQNDALQKVALPNDLIDFASNDYLGFSRSEIITEDRQEYLIKNKFIEEAATGSRFLSGSQKLYQETEDFIADFHQTQTALIFNSGSDATIGFFSVVPQKGDLILYDELCHAAIQDGIQMSNAKACKFNHNDFEDLESLIQTPRPKTQDPTSIYIVTESVFSMDGDCPNLEELVRISDEYHCRLVVDEAHALGVFGSKGEGFVQMLGLQDSIFARVLTFEDALGCQGAAILGSLELRDCLVNFAQRFKYTAGLSPLSVAAVLTGYQHLEKEQQTIAQLRKNIIHFNQEKNMLGLKQLFVHSKSAIQSAIITGNENVTSIAQKLQEKGFDVKAILSPTVPEGQERLRFCLHSYNSPEEISEVLQLLSVFIFSPQI
ncbi:aminotransferase class I/II-fold pyridoxal phosphate-dependent enzyme [Flavobacterium degerlachei]|jgi:8-amino-7-oxononanoate synthase|uniref:8-amino-7-oxononanoate synthase n=1 Tax=Flavobacterium degerlachei TaxID=229203 RepID=A0A1H2Q773_9FLAO|nr:pyridoxal phosphate-dependent aminotransferase family protein [Flavobacterium degerlachei]SDW02860.1 8-amino-7-oxononanoate synthase [Flavobacterium degerlachei]